MWFPNGLKFLQAFMHHISELIYVDEISKWSEIFPKVLCTTYLSSYTQIVHFNAGDTGKNQMVWIKTTGHSASGKNTNWI